MTLPTYHRLSKQEAASSQLEVALTLYLQGRDYPSVITLAGAAEEVLGRIALSKGLDPSLKRTLRRLVETMKEVWGEDASEKDFAHLRNRARNELKHIGDGQDLHLDLEREAAAMVTRALENFRLCTGFPHPGQGAFTSRKIANWRAKQTQGSSLL